MNFFTELKRRKVFRVAVVYAATAFVILQAADIMLPRMGVPDWAMSLVVALAVLGFPIALVLAWARHTTSLEGSEETVGQPEVPAIAAGHIVLPRPPTPLIGREREVQTAGEVLLREDVRLVTLTGAGGSGKTRLAIEVASTVTDHFADGTFFVNLAPLTDTDLIPTEIARTLQIREPADLPPRERVPSYLRDKQVLLVLDNFEQIVAGASFVGELLAMAPRLKILVTSRIRLQVRGEHEFAVPPLSLPASDQPMTPGGLTSFESVRLFIDRALATGTGFDLTDENAVAVAKICQRVDGLPLAIELAAARIRLLSPKDILDRLETRLEFLTGGLRDLPARQQTLRGTIAWSHSLLTENERVLFRRLAVFVGGRSLEAIQLVCAADDWQDLNVLDSVAALIDNNLLRQDTVDGHPRFVMLETIQEFAREQLTDSGEEEEMQRRHADYFTALAEEAEPHLVGAEQGQWLRRIASEHDNLRAALAWSIGSGESALALRLVTALWRFWGYHSHLAEGERWAQKALALVAAPPDLRGRVLVGIALLAAWQSGFARAAGYAREALDLFRQHGDGHGVAQARIVLGMSEAMRLATDGHSEGFEEPIRQIEAGLEQARELGESWFAAFAYHNLGEIARYLNDDARAKEHYEEARRYYMSLSPMSMQVGSILFNLGLLAFARDDFEQASQHFSESLHMTYSLGERRGIAHQILGIGGVLVASGDAERGAVLLAAAHAEFARLNTQPYPADWPQCDRMMDIARATLGSARLDQAQTRGRQLSLDEAYRLACR